jgi:hypothetical protein
MPTQTRDRVARGVELGGAGVAGGVGVALGAQRLRDSYREDYGPERYAGHVATAERGAAHLAPSSGGAIRHLSEGRVRFPALVAGTTAAVAAGSAGKYRQYREKQAKKIAAAKEGKKDPLIKALLGERKEPRARVSARSGQARLRSIGRTDESVRAVRRQIMPTTTSDLIESASQGVDSAEDKIRAQFSKYYDPERNRKRRYQAAAAGLAGGAGATGVAAVRQYRTVDPLKRRAAGLHTSSGQSFRAARMHEQQIDEVRAGVGVPPGKPGNVGSSIRRHVAAMDTHEQARRLRHADGMRAWQLGNAKHAEAAATLRRAHGKAALVAVLAAGSVAARQRAHRYDYR